MEFRDLKRQYEKLKGPIDQAIAKVISSAHFISGSQVKELETALADYIGIKHCISCANGTDAISIALLAYGIGAGDAVFVPDFTFFSSGECPAIVGATPIFVDVKADTYNLSSSALEEAIEKVLFEGELIPRVVVAVDLFGQPFDVSSVRDVCDRHGLLLLEDAAQGFGGRYTFSNGKTRKACSFGDISTTSFFPAKPLGCYGDGGAIFTDDDEIAMRCRSIAVHGKDMEHPEDVNAKYNNMRLGMNSRLDTLQAAILLEKLQAFREFELERVNKFSEMYTSLLSDVEGLTLPFVEENCYSSWAQYTVQLPEGINRAKVQTLLKVSGIPTNVYYIKPMHVQGAFTGTRSAKADCPVTKELCERVLCLPIHPYLTEEEIFYITGKIREVLQYCSRDKA